MEHEGDGDASYNRTISKGLVKGQDDSEIRGRVETI